MVFGIVMISIPDNTYEVHACCATMFMSIACNQKDSAHLQLVAFSR